MCMPEEVGGNEPSLSHLWLCTSTIMTNRLLCTICTHTTGSWNCVMYCYVYTLQTVGGNEPSLSHLWLCTSTIMTNRLLCIICTHYRQLELCYVLLRVHATDSWRIWAISLICGCAHILLNSTVHLLSDKLVVQPFITAVLYLVSQVVPTCNWMFGFDSFWGLYRHYYMHSIVPCQRR